ncbi:MAG: VWA domain-containing protein [Pyrinomonadaceae bacterium]
MTEELALRDLFMHLVGGGMPLGVRDYRDALRALRAGYGFGSRARLQALLDALWARTEEESRQLDRAFRRLPRPTEEEAARELERLTGHPRPKPEVDAADADARAKDAPPGHARGQEEQEPAPLPRFESPTRGERTDTGLPRADARPRHDEAFILEPRPLIPLRSLVIIWRRYRAAMRAGPKVELDVAATVAEQCRRGYLAEPVLVPARRNQARLVLLIDVSPSMQPWEEFSRTLVESLRRGRLGEAHVYYFHNSPHERLYESATLSDPVTLKEALVRHESSTLMLVSDAGAARGARNAERAEEAAEFWRRVREQWQPAVWMNPMPSSRWERTTAEAVSKLTRLKMLELNEERLVTAVDILRGLRRG